MSPPSLVFHEKCLVVCVVSYLYVQGLMLLRWRRCARLEHHVLIRGVRGGAGGAAGRLAGGLTAPRDAELLDGRVALFRTAKDGPFPFGGHAVILWKCVTAAFVV